MLGGGGHRRRGNRRIDLNVGADVVSATILNGYLPYLKACTAVVEVINWAALRADHGPLGNLPAVLRKAATRSVMTRGECIFRTGAEVNEMHYVLSGEVRMLRRGRSGTEIILQRTRRGFVAEASLDSGHYHCDAMVAESGDLLRFPVRAFRKALARDAAFRTAWIAHLAQEVRRLRVQCERLNLRSARERIIHYIESEGAGGAVVLTQTKKAWATEIGMSHESLYRTLRRLREQGVLRLADERITLVGRGA